MITIVDTGLCNIGSVANMLRKLGVRPTVAPDASSVKDARALILPGIGHFDAGMKNLEARGLAEALTRKVVEERTPILGICLGMQLLARRSEEGVAAGLGWIAADVRRFRFREPVKLPVPHMGWSEVDPIDTEMFRGHEPRKTRFYFVHSFHVVPDDPSLVAAWADYGGRFVAAVRQAHVWGAQFHPEKSHRHGMNVLKNYVEAVRRDA